MILLVSGEGSTDIGSCINGAGECDGADFRPGAMAVLIDQLVEPLWGYSPLDSSAMVFISEHELIARSKHVTALPKQAVLPGPKGARDTAFFFKSARALAQMAKERTKAGCPVGAVLFRDADGTNSAANDLRLHKVSSIERGFAAETFDLGVAMVPRPKSEAWILCALQPAPYTNCARFEDLPGNDGSPNAAKPQVEGALGAIGKEVVDLPDLVRAGTIGAMQISMPSYDEFRQRMEEVATKMVT